MIKLSTTSWASDNTTCVTLESHFISFNSYRDRLFGDCSFKLRNALSDVMITCGSSLGWGVLGLFAWSISGSVSVVLFVISSIWFVPFESVVHKSSVATLVTIFRTVDKLLFSITFKFASFDCHGSFKCCYGRESPAWSTLTLVFDFVDGTFLSPIYFSG